MVSKKTEEEFYEDVGDILADFRKKVGGPIYPEKKGRDPFDDDPDVIQSKRQDKLQDTQSNLNLGY